MEVSADVTNIAMGNFNRLGKEIIDGVAVLMSPVGVTHGRTTRNLLKILGEHLDNSHCEVFSNVLVLLDPETNVLAPDISVLCDLSLIKDDIIHGAPDLVAEVLSPSTAYRDKNIKKEKYGKYGVKEYWIVDARNFIVEVYLNNNGQMELSGSYVVLPKWERKQFELEGAEMPPHTFESSLLKGLSIDLKNIFKNILPEDY